MGDIPEEQELDHEFLEQDLDRSTRRHRMTGIAAAYSLHMTLPGGSAPVAGVTWVGVLPRIGAGESSPR